MLKYLFNNREGQFLIVGTILMILGFILSFSGSSASQFVFYGAMFFLGFFATKDAIQETFEDRSPNVDLLMILAALGAALIRYESEGAALLFIFAAAEMLEHYASDKTTSAIEELMSFVPETAERLLDNGETETVLTSELHVGDRVLVSKGEQVPIDGTIDRNTSINEAALTGESVPVDKQEGDEAYAGTINEGHAFVLTVSASSDETVFSNIIRMVDEAQNRPSRISQTIDRIESKYVISVLIVVPIFILVLYGLLNYSFQDAFYRGMVLLTVASPCALVASATPATLSAISNGAKNGVLFKGGAAMEAFSTMDRLYTDKTGTITLGEFKVVDYQLSDEDLAEVVYMEQQSTHPIAVGIVNSFKDISLDQVNKDEPVEEIAGSGLQKGNIKIGKPSAFKTYQDPNNYLSQMNAGYTSTIVGRGNEVVGYLALEDEVRPEADIAVRKFQDSGVEVHLITGDNEEVAKKVANQVAIEHYHANCLPEDKITFVQETQEENKVVGMIGDGINDAPALANADIGIAMGSGSSVAMESSDVVIVQNNLNKLFHSYELSKRLNTIIKQNLIFSIGVIVILIILNLLGWLDLPKGVLFHEGSTILVILNGLRLLKSSYSDN